MSTDLGAAPTRPAPAAADGRLTVLHTTEALGAGVQSAIYAYTTLLPDVRHVVLARGRDGMTTYAWPANVEFRSFAGSVPQYLAAVRRAVLTDRPGVVHLHSSIAGLVRLRGVGGIATVYSPHCFAFERLDVGGAKRAAFRLVERLLARRAHVLAAVSPRERQLAEALAPGVRATYVPNVSTVAALPCRETARRRQERVVVTVGRLLPQKDPRFFAAVARRTEAECTFVWIGDGDPTLRADLEAAGVVVTGWLPPDEVRRRVAGADLYLHTAAWEAAPISTVEAAAVGTPVMARDIASMRSLGYWTTGPSSQSTAAEVDRYFTVATHRQSVVARTEALTAELGRELAQRALRDTYRQAVDLAGAR